MNRPGIETLAGAKNPGSPRYTRGLVTEKRGFAIVAASICITASLQSQNSVDVVVVVVFPVSPAWNLRLRGHNLASMRGNVVVVVVSIS